MAATNNEEAKFIRKQTTQGEESIMYKLQQTGQSGFRFVFTRTTFLYCLFLYFVSFRAIFT